VSVAISSVSLQSDPNVALLDCVVQKIERVEQTEPVGYDEIGLRDALACKNMFDAQLSAGGGRYNTLCAAH